MQFNDEPGCVEIAGESCCSQYCQQTARRKVASDGNSFSAPAISLLHVHFHLDSFGFKEQRGGVLRVGGFLLLVGFLWFLGVFFVLVWVSFGLSSALDSSAQWLLML